MTIVEHLEYGHSLWLQIIVPILKRELSRVFLCMHSESLFVGMSTSDLTS